LPLNSIVKIIETEIENYEIAHDTTLKNNIIAKIMHVTPSEVTRFRNGDKMLHLDKIIKLIRFLCPHKELELMYEICNLVLETEKPYIIREAMEYCSTARFLDVLDKIIENQLMEGNKENKELAKVYSLVMRYQQTRRNFDDVFYDIEHTIPSRVCSKLLLKSIKCLILQHKKEFSHMERILREAETLFDELDCEDDFILNSYKVRFTEIKATVALNVYSDFKKARKLAKRVIDSDICAIFKVHSYYTIGNSYLFDDYDATMNYFKQYYDLLLLDGRTESAKIVKEQDMVFAKIVHGQELETIKTSDISEIAHLEARWGDKQKALKLIEQAVKEQGMSVFKQYYKALALDDPVLLYESLITFINSGLKFYANLVHRDLLKFGGNWGTIAEIALKNLTFK